MALGQYAPESLVSDMAHNMQLCQKCFDYRGAEDDMVDIGKTLPEWICQHCALDLVRQIEEESLEAGVAYVAPAWIRQLRVL